MSQPGLGLRSGKIITLVPGEHSLGGRSDSVQAHGRWGEKGPERERKGNQRGVLGRGDLLLTPLSLWCFQGFWMNHESLLSLTLGRLHCGMGSPEFLLRAHRRAEQILAQIHFSSRDQTGPHAEGGSSV